MPIALYVAFFCLTVNVVYGGEQNLMTEEQKTLYFLGQTVSSKIKQYEFSPEDTKYIVMGFSDALVGQKGEVNDSYRNKLNELLAKKEQGVITKQKEADKPFLDKMADEPGAQKLPSGVIVIPEKEGLGAYPTASDKVKVHYHGTFPDGRVFDSSVERGTPAEFPLDGVITCWTEGVQKIKVGGKAKLVCPSDTAYGDKGAGGVIPGGATLVFGVELLGIVGEENRKNPNTRATATSDAESYSDAEMAQMLEEHKKLDDPANVPHKNFVKNNASIACDIINGLLENPHDSSMVNQLNEIRRRIPKGPPPTWVKGAEKTCYDVRKYGELGCQLGWSFAYFRCDTPGAFGIAGFN